jgi:hypothetical protein
MTKSEEIRDRFMKKVVEITQDWAKEERVPDVEDKLSGLAFSLLVLIDGGYSDGGIPNMRLVPSGSDEAINEGRDLHDLLRDYEVCPVCEGKGQIGYCPKCGRDPRLVGRWGPKETS